MKKPKLCDYLYADLTFGTEINDKEIIGVCVIPADFLPDGKARFMSIVGMNTETPDVGGKNK